MMLSFFFSSRSVLATLALLAAGPIVLAQSFNPCIGGEWQPSINLGSGGAAFRTSHATLIPRGPAQGMVLIWGPNYKDTSDPLQYYWRLNWKVLDPVQETVPYSGTLSTIAGPDPADNEGNISCSGHALTPDGDLFVVGGHLEHGTAQGSMLVYRFKPMNLGAGTDPWVRLVDTKKGRWYGTVKYVPADSANSWDEHMLVFGGRDHLRAYTDDYESYNLQTGTWDSYFVGGIQTFTYSGPPGISDDCKDFLVYPRLRLLRTGDFFLSAYTMHSASLNPAARSAPYLEADWDDGYSGGSFEQRVDPCSVLMPLSLGTPSLVEQVLVLGGKAKAVNDCPGQAATTKKVEVMNFAPGNVWSDAPEDMRFARSEFNTVVLPDGNLFVVGGEESTATTILPAELYENSTWKLLNRPDSARGEHAVVLLLPSSKVLVGGGDDRFSDFQVFEPPYFHCGNPQPVITYLSTETWSYGGSVSANFTGAVSKVVLTRVGSVTHGLDGDQRMVILDTTIDNPNGQVTISVPTQAQQYVVPSGYYMMFLVSDLGVPSTASFIHLS